MTETNTRRVILDLAVEDSYALSELVSRVRQTMSWLSPHEAKELARSTVDELLEAGYLSVTKLETPNGSETMLDPMAARAAVADDLAWLELAHWRPHVRVVATEAGKEAYYREV